jgi:hypothetical protein
MEIVYDFCKTENIEVQIESIFNWCSKIFASAVDHTSMGMLINCKKCENYWNIRDLNNVETCEVCDKTYIYTETNLFPSYIRSNNMYTEYIMTMPSARSIPLTKSSRFDFQSNLIKTSIVIYKKYFSRVYRELGM